MLNRKSFLFFVMLVFLGCFALVASVTFASHNPSHSAEVSNALDFLNKPNLPTTNMLLLIVLSFVAGTLSFLSPCTLPILPAYFAVTFQADRKKIVLMSVMFFFGLASLFVLMGASASLFGSMLRKYLFSLTKIGGVIVAVFGVMTLFGKGFSGASFMNKSSSTMIGSFIFGATFAMGWTPCIGPILSGILVVAATDKTIYQGMLLLFFYALGLGLPLIAISSIFGHMSKESLFWRILKGRGWEVRIAGRNIYMHSTNLLTGILLISLGFFLAAGYMTALNSYIPIGIQKWFNGLEHKLMTFF